MVLQTFILYDSYDGLTKKSDRTPETIGFCFLQRAMRSNRRNKSLIMTNENETFIETIPSQGRMDKQFSRQNFLVLISMTLCDSFATFLCCF